MRLPLIVCSILLGLVVRTEMLVVGHWPLVAMAIADAGDGGDGGDGGEGGGDGDGNGGEGGEGDGENGVDGHGESESEGESEGESSESDDSDDDPAEATENEDPMGAERDGGPDGNDRFVAGEIVLVAEQLNARQRGRLSANGFRVISESELTAFRATVARLAIPAGSDEAEAATIAQTLMPEAILDLNHTYAPNGAPCADAVCWGQRAVARDDLPAMACRDGPPVALVDTALTTAHPALASADITTRSFLPSDMSPAPADHATAIAALLVGNPAPGARPLAPGARLLVAEVVGMVDGKPHGDAVSVLRGIDWAVRSGARVIGLSIEGAPNRALAFGVRAGARIATLVAAAGNRGPKGPPAYPAAYPEVIAASAIDARLRPYRGGTRGDYVEVTAPGVAVLSAGPAGTTRSWTGSSFAVPFVIAAFLRTLAETEGDSRAARKLVNARARDLGPPGRDEVYGYGLVQSQGSRCH